MATKYAAELEAGDVIEYDGQTWYVTGKGEYRDNMTELFEVPTTNGVITFDYEAVAVEYIDHQ